MEGEEDASMTIEIVQQRIGRNLLLFQKLEYTLKMMVAMSDISGYAADLEENKERRKAWAMKQTLGQIVGEHVESFNPADEQGSEPSPMKREPYFSMRITMQCENDFLDKRKSVLAGFVKERNELVHHLLATYKLNDEESRRQLVAMLDNQHQRLKEEVDLSFELGKSQFETRREVAAWLQSEEGRKFMVNEREAGGLIDAPNKPILSDKSMSSCLLQKAQKPRQHTFAPDQERYVPSIRLPLYDRELKK